MKPGEKIMKTKKVLSLIFLFFLLFFNAFAIISAYNENHKNYEVISKEVTIIEKYTIGSPADSNNYSKYMTGEDDEGNQYKIPNQTADIGDKITIYANPNSANYNGGDREWHTSETGLKNSNNAGIVIYSIASVIIIIMIDASIKELKSIKN